MPAATRLLDEASLSSPAFEYAERPDRNARPAALVVIPTYNERDNLGRIVAEVLEAQPQVDVLVVDDNSPDGTGVLADRLAALDDRVNVLHRPGKQGLGAAYLAAFAWALDHDYDAVVEMDADGSHPPEQLQRLFAMYDHADLVLGSRWVSGGSVDGWPLVRELLSRGGNLYVRLLLGLPLRDATGGFRIFRTDTLRALDLDTVDSQGYCFQVDLARRAIARGFTVVEVPIDFRERQLGRSKMDGSIVREALWRVTLWGVGERLRRRGPVPPAFRRDGVRAPAPSSVA